MPQYLLDCETGFQLTGRSLHFMQPRSSMSNRVTSSEVEAVDGRSKWPLQQQFASLVEGSAPVFAPISFGE